MFIWLLISGSTRGEERGKTRKTYIIEQATMIGNGTVVPLEENESQCLHSYTMGGNGETEQSVVRNG